MQKEILNRILFFLLIACLIFPCVSAENVADIQNFNETYGLDYTIGSHTVGNITDIPHVGVIFYQPVEQVYDKAWMPIWLFFMFFFGGIGAILGASYRRKTDTEMWFALIAFAFLTICYITQPFVVEQGVVSSYYTYTNTTEQMDPVTHHVMWVQPYTFAIAVPYLPQICQLFWICAMLNLFLSLYNFIRYGLLKPKPVFGGTNHMEGTN